MRNIQSPCGRAVVMKQKVETERVGLLGWIIRATDFEVGGFSTKGERQ